MAHPTHAPHDIAELIARIDDAVARRDPHRICDGVRSALRDLTLHHGAGIPEDLRATIDSGYARRLLHRCPLGTYSIMIMCWKPGEGTSIHDHAGRWCVECVLEGEIDVTSFDPDEYPPGDICRFSPREQVRARLGDVGVLVPPQEYHQMRNPGPDRAVTVHVYEGELLWCHSYHAQGEGVYRKERCSLSYTD